MRLRLKGTSAMCLITAASLSSYKTISLRMSKELELAMKFLSTCFPMWAKNKVWNIYQAGVT